MGRVTGPTVMAYNAWRKRLENRFGGFSFLNVEMRAQKLAGHDRVGDNAWFEMPDEERDRYVDAAVSAYSGDQARWEQAA